MGGPWLLPSIVLGIGLLLGLGAAVLVRRREPARPSSDVELRRSDLERTYRQALADLRELPDDATADRGELERLAASALRDLEALPSVDAPATPTTTAEAQAEPAVAAAPVGAAGGDWFQRHPLVAGALLGGGMVALLAVLIVWAMRDATPAPVAEAVARSGAPTTAEERGEPPLPPMVARQVEELRARIEATPEDVTVRRELAQLLLVHSQYFDAFQEAQALLARDPDDPDGLYVSALVRYTMGQAQPAVELLDRAVTVRPDSPQAWLVLGLIRLQLDDRAGAIETWDRGLAANPAGDPRLEHVLRLAREGRSAQEILSTPPG